MLNELNHYRFGCYVAHIAGWPKPRLHQSSLSSTTHNLRVTTPKPIKHSRTSLPLNDPRAVSSRATPSILHTRRPAVDSPEPQSCKFCESPGVVLLRFNTPISKSHSTLIARSHTSSPDNNIHAVSTPHDSFPKHTRRWPVNNTSYL
jgi:hypothetical protein